jgi:hypothetical protein
MSLELRLILFAMVVLLLVGYLMYFVSKRSSRILRLVWQNEHYQVYELVQIATTAMMYESLILDFDKLLMNSSEQDDFVCKHKDKLSSSRGNLFLNKRYSLRKAEPNNLFTIIITLKTTGGYFESTSSYLGPGFWEPGIHLIIPRQKS